MDNFHTRRPPSNISFWITPTFLAPLQPLLTWQSISLFWLCGLFAARYPIGGICAATTIFCLDTRLRSKKYAPMAICCFVIGFVVLHLAIVPRPNYPTWALEGQKPRLMRLEGSVSKVESLTNKRLRIYLDNVHSLEHPEHVLPGLTIWTWEAKRLDEKLSQDHKNIVPLAGQKVQISARIRSAEGFNNEGLSSFGFYWQSQGVFWRLWSRGDFGNPQIIEQDHSLPHTLARIRQKALQTLEQNLFTPSLDLTSIKAQAYAFLPALLFGEKYYISQESMEKMRAASLVHSLALSGQHLAIVGLCAALFAGILYLVYPQSLIILPYTKWTGLFALPLALLYLWIGNAPPSLIRAAIMLSLALIFYWRARLATLGDILLMTLLLITFYQPAAIFNLGLQLSVLCVASIALVVPLLRRIPKPNQSFKTLKPLQFFTAKLGRSILQIFIISLSIQCVLAPIFLYYFPPSGPWFICNIIWLPILGFWVLPLALLGSVVAILGLTEISMAILHLAAWPCEILLQTLNYMQIKGFFEFPAILRPHWTVYIAWGALCLALAILVGRTTLQEFLHNKTSEQLNKIHHKILLILAMFFLLVGPIIRYTEYWLIDVKVDMLDVGQGQAVCISLKGGERILVDGGGSMSKNFDTGTHLVIPHLVYNKPPRLWGVIATHPDMDHLRGLMAVLQKMQVGTFYHNGKKMHSSYTKIINTLKSKNKMPPTKILHSGISLTVPSINNSFKLEVLNPPQNRRLSSNNASIVLRLVHEENNTKHGIALLGADAEIFAQQNILKLKQNISADIFILPHHGSKDALWQPFYDAVNAQIALVSTAMHNNFSFPHLAVLKTLKAKNIPLYSTAHSNGISAIWQKNTPYLRIKTYKDANNLALPKLLH